MIILYAKKILIIGGLLCLFSMIAVAKSALIQVGNDDDSKIPLILIHGIHGTPKNQSVTAQGTYWEKFIGNYSRDNQPSGLLKKYALYLFQYESDIDNVQTISVELGRALDRQLLNRQRVILAHSMGGLVAKFFMTYYVHSSGAWRGKKGGETTLGLITLATPHHGTPGANDTNALKNYFPSLIWEKRFKAINILYYQFSTGFLSPSSVASFAPNRSDLRWDNYDLRLDSDINTESLVTNQRFKNYSDRVILYGGILKPIKPDLDIKTFEDAHSKLTFADGMLFYGLGENFGYTDGLVPFKSALLCDTDTAQFVPSQRFVCHSSFRVRRFEFGAAQQILPEGKTLSVTRNGRGFDHQEMFEEPSVLKRVREDLLKFAEVSIVKTTPTKSVLPELPTIFLLDVSGSMIDNDKIGQAKVSSLQMVKEMQENRKRGQDNSNVSVWLFGGECAPQDVRQILPFTTNLTQAETVFRSRIPKPDGATPLHTAIDVSIGQMSGYLGSRPNLSEGRIIVLSDGENTCEEQIRPRGVYSQGSNIVHQKIRFLTIGFNVSAGSKAERDLQYLASISGGKYISADNQQQLSRAFEKMIRVYLPKLSGAANIEFERGVQTISKRDFSAALQIWTIYVQANPTDALGFYNLALTCEAAEDYKRAVENYQKYLKLAPDSSDAAEIRARIAKLEEDYRIEFVYYLNLLRSDLEYLKEYYKRLFGLKNDELAAEFAGFVAEKGVFYRNLAQILEIRSVRIERNANDLADSLDFLNRRVGSPSFDRDAVSLLTVPIGHLEELVERIDEYKAKNLQ